MKRLILLTFSILIAFIGNAQIKHNKFATRITFDQFNPNPEYWKTSVSEIKDNSGYFLTNFYDDQAYGFHPSLVKLDVDGSIVFDTVYEFTPINSSGYTNIVNSVTKITSHTALYQTGSLGSQVPVVAPYIMNFDLNGNVNWHVGFTDDTLDLEVSKLIPTQDGGYVIAGKLYDWGFGIYPVSGFAIKLDNLGNMLWHKMYSNKDTMETRFDDGIETPDGGLFYIGSAPNFTGGAKLLDPWDITTCMVKTDNLGNVIWSSANVVDAPIDNGYGPSDFSVGMLNSTDAFVSTFVRDSTGNGQDKFAITSVNVNNGIHNWTKMYSLPPGEGINVRRAIPDGKGNIIVSASYYGIPATGVLFVIDGLGNVINTKRFNHMGASFPYQAINTMDGGFAYISEIDQNEILMVKTDKNLESSCPAIDSVFAFSLSSVSIGDTSYFGNIDSVFSLTNLNPVVLSSGSPIATSSDDSLICSCNNTVFGTVLEGGVTPVNNAKVFLFRKGMVPFPWKPIDSTITDIAGAYQFDYVPTDSFIVRVTPDTLLFPGAMTSYFKEPIWCYRWDLAGVFSVHCDSGAVQKDVKLVVPPALSGNSSLAGYVFESYGSFNKGQMQPGDPIPGIDITVDQSPGGIAGGSTSNTNGHYSLSGLDTNKTYIVTIDFPGLPHDSVWTININLNDTTLDSLNFYIDSTGIYILDQQIGVGIDVVQTDNIDVDLFPNPSNGVFTVNINAIKPENIELQLTDKVGREIYKSSRRIVEGDNSIIFDETQELPTGIYFLKIQEGNNLHIKKIVKL